MACVHADVIINSQIYLIIANPNIYMPMLNVIIKSLKALTIL